MNNSICDLLLSDVIRELEETMEKANLLALELALRELDNPAGGETFPLDIDGISQFAACAANATEEIERIVRRVKAA